MAASAQARDGGSFQPSFARIFFPASPCCTAATSKPDDEDKECPVCMCEIEHEKILDKCKHVFCRDCIDRAFEYDESCPVCKTRYGIMKGNQPKGATMRDTVIADRLPGHDCSTIVIDYYVPDGYQGVSICVNRSIWPNVLFCRIKLKIC